MSWHFWGRRACLVALFALAACGRDDDGNAPRTTGAVQSVAAPPALGASGVVTADPTLARPATTPCVVTLYADVQFADFSEHPFAYDGGACTGPVAKVVLEADFAVTAGRQFDRTAQITVGGITLYFGTTQEPSATVAPTWRVERDVTEYAAAVRAAAAGNAALDNVVNDTYTGVISGSARLLFYPPASESDDAALRIADVVVPFNGDAATGRPAQLADGDAQLKQTLTLPTNVVRAYLDVYAQSQGGDEFWWTCVPDGRTDALQSCGGGSFREVWVRIDGQPAGIAPVYPWIYTGGVDPGLWRPTPGIETLAFVPRRVDLTPFAGVLSDGQPHDVAIAVEGAHGYFAVAANLLVYRDADAATTGGALTVNTLADARFGTYDTADGITVDGSDASGTVGITSGRDYTIGGYVDTSNGRVTTTVRAALTFSNQQTFAIDATQYSQKIDQLTTADATVTTEGAGRTLVATQRQRYPLAFEYRYDNGANLQTSSFTQSLSKYDGLVRDGASVFASQVSDDLAGTSQLQFDADGNVVGRLNQAGSQTVAFYDTLGSCYGRSITTAANALTAVTNGGSCPSGANGLNWLSQPDGAPVQGVWRQLGW